MTNYIRNLILKQSKHYSTEFLNIIHNVDNKKLNKYSKTAIKTFLNFENYNSNELVEDTNNIIR